MTLAPNRRRRREMVAIEREARCLEGLIAGKNQTQIAAELGIAQSYVSTLMKRALERRALPDGPEAEQARRIYVLRLEALVRSYWPLATGTWRAEEGDPALPPDVRSGELLLKILTQLAAVQSKSLGEAVQNGQRMDVYHHVGDDQSVIAQIMGQLAQAAQHGRVVEGKLADVGTELASLTGHAELADSPHAPADWQPEDYDPDEDETREAA